MQSRDLIGSDVTNDRERVLPLRLTVEGIPQAVLASEKNCSSDSSGCSSSSQSSKMSEGTSEAVGQENPQAMQHPWPYLQELFEIAGTKDNSYRMRCKPCTPKRHELMAFKNSPSNLKKTHTGKLYVFLVVYNKVYSCLF